MLSVKTVHLICVVLTLVLFLLRARWALRGSGMLQKPWVRIAPHVIDTVLLLSGVLMAWSLYGAYFYTQAWLMAKLLAVLLYIVFGSLAIKRARTRTLKIFSLVLSCFIFLYIVTLALNKQVLWFLA